MNIPPETIEQLKQQSIRLSKVTLVIRVASMVFPVMLLFSLIPFLFSLISFTFFMLNLGISISGTAGILLSLCHDNKLLDENEYHLEQELQLFATLEA